MKKEDTKDSSQKNHSIEAILGIIPSKRSPSRILKSFKPHLERNTGKNAIDCSQLLKTSHIHRFPLLYQEALGILFA